MLVDCPLLTPWVDVFICCRKRKKRRRKRRRKKKKRRRKPKNLIQALQIKCDDQTLRSLAAIFYAIHIGLFSMTVDGTFFVCSGIAFTELFDQFRKPVEPIRASIIF